ncbi:MAG: hypothetical protein A2186_01140 [Candidatus Levybacteria bacterium RIFOXYA1_FULL_41_10]|nr:MAG: hypothetical protein UT46_C0009G0008 [Candidatus Levybacteria bacterium GW2011_GWA1_39_34]KKR51443.1 MAG: hypothetical protein UT87_C0006G0023 [Candidatus Levybacteria bacterium GW2011_GWC1_40_19]KKR71078.1 MAG: hypothetical protein UU15_C0060G0003 [Candidatus Levybacteria bacterium GW2011_GWC2_40_7]KKR94860.1 MAG: hypothetical protein UU45_C0006G0022 [Candidatus Levybacteria bacterium GW2011_GWA2_41_15]KKS01491.1 MAG: hypothetical protein UU52_C0011G0008 [Candidatus Levybacteria bacter
MADPAQTILLVVILILSILLVVLGIQVFLILRDLRETIAKANKVLDDAGQIAQSVSAPVSTISSILMGIKTGAIASSIFSKKGKKEKE